MPTKLLRLRRCGLSGSDPSTQESQPAKRGKGRGGKFFAVDREIWERLWEVTTFNRLNFVSTYLVLSAGTGSDHQLSKWSTKACERYIGIGKPRAKVAVDELIEHGLAEHTEKSTRAFPQYRLQPVPLESDPIFLPIAIVTGLNVEASMLRRTREAGDPLLLRMLVDLYGMTQVDATFGLPISALSQIPLQDYPARKVFEVGVHAIWAVRLGGAKTAGGTWTEPHRPKGHKTWENFWARVSVLENIGAIWYEPWAFDGAANDAEPLFPVDSSAVPGGKKEPEVSDLMRVMYEASEALTEGKAYLLDRYEDDLLVSLSLHRQAPSIRGVARMRIEADTPGRRLSYHKRHTQIEVYQSGYAQVLRDALDGKYSRPMNTAIPVST
jgi:hypothetical protein